MQEIYLRYRCGEYPTKGHFYMLLYDDPYHATLAELWHVTVHTTLRVDLNAKMGQRSVCDLIVKGDRQLRKVMCYSSHPADTVCTPGRPFQLVSGAFNKIAVAFQPRALGQKNAQLHLVDLDTHELVSSWLLCTTTGQPVVTKTYDLDLPVGIESHKVCKRALHRRRSPPAARHLILLRKACLSGPR